MEVTWIAKEYDIRQKTLVCSKINEGAEWYVRNWDKFVDIILPTNRWADRMNESGVGTVSLVLCRTLAKELVRMARDNWVCSQQ